VCSFDSTPCAQHTCQGHPCFPSSLYTRPALIPPERDLPRYGSVGPAKCKACYSRGVNTLLYVLITLVTVIPFFLAAQVQGTTCSCCSAVVETMMYLVCCNLWPVKQVLGSRHLIHEPGTGMSDPEQVSLHLPHCLS
jgi:hypothetical protein